MNDDDPTVRVRVFQIERPTADGRSMKMTWRRLATFAAGGALFVVGVLLPPAAAVLVPAGTLLVGFATKWPGDTTPPKKEDTP